MNKPIGTIIKAIRTEKGLRQEDVSTKAGLSRGYIARLEANDFKTDGPTINNLQKIANALSVPLGLILQNAGLTTVSLPNKTENFRYATRLKYKLTNKELDELEEYIQRRKKQKHKR